MKNNLISAIAGWKSAALLALVAMVAAVAFSGVLTNTESADAQDAPDVSVSLEQGDVVGVVVTLPGTWSAEPTTTDTVTGTTITPTYDTNTKQTTVKIAVTSLGDPPTVTTTPTVLTFTGTEEDGSTAKTATVGVTVVPWVGHPGTTVYFAAPAGTGLITIHSDSTALGSFPDNPGRSFITCDTDDTSDSTADAPRPAADTGCDRFLDTGIVLRIAIDADSPAGSIFVRRGTEIVTERTITVTPTPISAELAITPAAPVSISSSAAADDSDATSITATVTTSGGAGIEDVTVLFVASLGRFVGTDCNSLPVCSKKTDKAGVATVSLEGDNRAGAATVTVTAGELSGSKDVTFYGKAAALSAENAGGITAINQDGAAFVIFTVTDKDGNPVPDVTTIETKVTSEIEDATGVTDTAKLYPGLSPATTDDVRSCAGGTNAAGQCAVEVAASATATRGTHTVTGSLDIPGPPKATLMDSVDVTVAGASASISHDAPGRIDTLEEIKVTLTVTDDEGDLVGSQPINVTKVEGGGAILDDTADNTANGSASFTFLASSIAGDVVFVVRSGDARAVITVAVGPEPEPVVEEAPEAPPATWNNELVSGQNVVVWNGADGADPSEGAAEGVSAIWSYNTGSGSWDGYFPDAADVPGGNTLGSLSSNQAYVVIVN